MNMFRPTDATTPEEYIAAAPYAVVLGEALIDLLESEREGERVYREMVGGAPLNVAVGIVRLGGAAEFVGSLGDDVLAGRIRGFLDAVGVGTRGCVTVGVPTTIALTSFDGAEPDFRFYGEPPSYALLAAGDVDTDVVAGAGVLYCGSIALLRTAVLDAARAAWAVDGPLRTFDPNVRPHLLNDPAALRAVVEEFAATADLVKLSAADATALYGASPEAAADLLRHAGAATVVVTLGGRGALVYHGSDVSAVEAPPVRALDATGAGDAVMAALIFGLLDRGTAPAGAEGWRALVRFAMAVAALVCEVPGGATAMPTLAAVRRRFPQSVPASPSYPSAGVGEVE